MEYQKWTNYIEKHWPKHQRILAEIEKNKQIIADLNREFEEIKIKHTELFQNENKMTEELELASKELKEQIRVLDEDLKILDDKIDSIDQWYLEDM